MDNRASLLPSSCHLRKLTTAAGLALTLGFAGCDQTSPTHLASSDADMRINLPAGGDDSGDLSALQISRPSNAEVPVKLASSRKRSPVYRSPMTVIGANERLAKLDKSGPTKDRMQWSLDQLRSHMRPPMTELCPGETTFVQVTQATPQLPTANAPVAPPIEVIEKPAPDQSAPAKPTPSQSTPGQTAPELIPTPEGQPDRPANQQAPSLDAPSLDAPSLDTMPLEKAANDSPKPMATDKPASDTPSEGLRSITDEGTANIPESLKPEDFSTWQTPPVTLFVTGQQNGYIEPCGCTGLDRQKGGVARRYTFMKDLMAQGWQLLPIDAGNQVRRVGKQASMKISWSTEALKKMNYESVGFGPDDLRLPATDLLQLAASDNADEATYVSANVVLYDESYIPAYKVIQRGGLMIGVTNVLDPDSMEAGVRTDAVIKPIVESAKLAMTGMTEQKATFKVLTFYGKEKAAVELVKTVKGFDLVVVAGGYGEPTYQPQAIPDTTTQMILTGNKAMYAGLVGLYADGSFKYARVPLTHEFADAPEMRKIMGEYQNHLQQVGFEELGLEPIPHPSGERFVGTATCAKCHEDAYDVWSGSAHAEATDSIVSPPEDRGDVPRHFDPECISCHVTGWNPQGYRPYTSGYESLEVSKHLYGNGCENCHGPGESHSRAEEENSGVSVAEIERLRKSMQLPLSRAKEHCMKCHDLDNSPDFHETDAFEDIYWPEVEH